MHIICLLREVGRPNDISYGADNRKRLSCGAIKEEGNNLATFIVSTNAALFL